MNDKEKLDFIKKGFVKSHDTLPTGQTLLDDGEILWLIQQAEKVENIVSFIEGKWSTEMVSVNTLHHLLKDKGNVK